ncbi:MAG: VWA domain-containing protein [Pyrinomonadaceae bacterium]
MPASVRAVTTAVVSVLICLPGLPGRALSQTQPPSKEQTDVVRVFTELVQTDVTVFDKDGRFKNDLQREDFELRIDGKVKPIAFFERITAGTTNEEAQLAAARGMGTPTRTKGEGPTPLDRGRTVFFYVDDLHLDLAGAEASRKVINRFIDAEMGQNDEVAITSASGMMGFLQQLTGNKTVLRRALERLRPQPNMVQDMQRPTMTEFQALRIDNHDRDVIDFYVDAILRESPFSSRQAAESMVESRANQILRQAANTTRNSLIGLDSLVRSATRLPGRKLLFLLSNGFFINDRNADVRERLQRITSAAARSGVVIYSMDARGLVGTLMDASTEAPFDSSFRLRRSEGNEISAAQDGLHALAHDTGGRTIFNTNDLLPGLKKALAETATYYLLAWKPDSDNPRSSKFHRIEVKLINKPGLAARVRRGFYDMEPAPEPNAVKDRKPAEKPSEPKLWEVVGSPVPDRGIPLYLNLIYLDTPQKGGLLSAAIQVPTEFLTLNVIDGKSKSVIDLAGGIYDDKGRLGGSVNQRLTISAPAADSSLPPPKDFKYTFPLFLAPGLYQARFGVRDVASGKAGSVYEWIEIPVLAPGQVALSSLHVGERPTTPTTNASANNEDPNREVDLSVDHHFQSSSQLRFVIYVYNAARGADTKPDVALQVQVVRDNQPVITTPLKKVNTEGLPDLNRIPYAAELSLAGLTPGRYLLRVNVVDRVSKRSASQETRIEID